MVTPPSPPGKRISDHSAFKSLLNICKHTQASFCRYNTKLAYIINSVIIDFMYKKIKYKHKQILQFSHSVSTKLSFVATWKFLQYVGDVRWRYRLMAFFVKP